MHWISRAVGARSNARLVAVVAVLSLAAASLLVGAPEVKVLSVYSTLANYAVPITQENSQDYVGLIELLDPLGTVSAKADGDRWKLKFNNTEVEFSAGKTRVRKHGGDFDLTAPFFLQNGRGYVPTSTLLSLLPRVLGGPVTFHDAARRLFVGDAGIHFTAQVSNTTPPSLVLTFTAPVNPMISSEGGRTHMVFNRDALLAPSTPQLTFDSPVIRSANFEEGNGSAQIEVNSAAPLLVNFADGNRTITLTAAQSTPGAPGAPVVAQTPSAPAAPVGPRHYFAVIDPSHGGAETGAVLSDEVMEKDITLAIARRMRLEFDARGMPALLLRDSDVNPTLDQRASTANAARPSVYICIHAASMGNGVRIYTSLLPPARENRGPFVDWNTAQTPFTSLSQSVATAAQNQFQLKQIAVRSLQAPLRPLNNVAAPAIGLEVAPPGSDFSELTTSAYQQLVSSLVAQALAGMRGQLEAGR
jgi:N-acetylmuramoyl-L-alanine amidase